MTIKKESVLVTGSDGHIGSSQIKDINKSGQVKEGLVDRACLETLNRNARRTLLVNVFISVLIAGVIWFETGSQTIFIWLVANLLICGVRFINLIGFPESDAPPDVLKRLSRRHVIGAAAGGTVWGALIIMFLIPESPVLNAFLIVCLMGMGSGASASLSPHFPTFIAFITPALTPLILQLILLGDLINFVLATMGVLFTIALIASAKNTNRTLRESFEGKFKSDALARALEISRDELEDSETRFRDFAQSSSDWLWEMDGQFRVSYISGRFEAITGLPIVNVIGRSRRDLTEQQAINRDPEKWQRHFEDLESHRPFRDFQYEIPSKSDGIAISVSISGVPIFDENKIFSGYRGTGTDVTELYETQRDLVAAKEEAEKANQAKSEFLSSMSHELRTPLNSILGFTQLLQLDTNTPLSSNQEDCTDQVMRSGQHLLELVDQVLTLSKIEAGKQIVDIRPVSARQTLNDSLSMIQTMAGQRNITIDAQGQEWPDVDILIDATGFKQVLLNLLSNAVKYNQEGGSISVAAQLVDAGNIRISIRDTGLGIATDQQRKLFQPFNRLGFEASNIEGTGIGLVITRELLDLMNGTIDFESEEGKGSTFWVEVPVATS